MRISTGNFSRSYALFELRNLAKMKDTTVFFVSATPLKPLNRIAWNFLVMKDIMCRYAFWQEMLIWSFSGAIYIPFLSDCPLLMLGIAIHCIQHSQAMLERGVCELAHSFFHCIMKSQLLDILIFQFEMMVEIYVIIRLI